MGALRKMNNLFPKISIAILNHNGLERLKKTIKSLLNQEYSNYEILIFDNGSTDKSLNYLTRFKKIKLIKSKTNIGYGRAKNKLVKFCNGKYILLLDNDIELISKKSLSILLRDILKANQECFISPLVENIDTYEVIIGLSHNKLQKKYNSSRIFNCGLIKISAFRGNTVFFKKNNFVNLGGYDEVYPFNLDDYDLSARAYLMGFSIYADTNLIVKHHGIETRINLESISWKARYSLAGFSRMILKNYSIKNLIIWLPLAQVWITYKNIISCFKSSSLRPFFGHMISEIYVIRDFLNTLRERKIIQRKRKIKKDVFLKI